MPQIETAKPYWQLKAEELETAELPEKARWYRIRRPSAPGTTPFGAAEPLATETTIISSGDARETITEDRKKLEEKTYPSDIYEVSPAESARTGDPVKLKEGVVEVGGKYKTEAGLTAEEMAALGIEEEGDSDEVKALKGEIAGYDSQYDDLYGQLDDMRAAAKVATEDLIDSIKSIYESRRTEMRDINKRSLASMRTFGIRMGTARYSPLIATGVLSSEERAGLARITSLDADEARAVSAAKAAEATQDWELLHDQIGILETKRAEKKDELEKLQEAALEKNKEVADQITKVSRQGAVVGLIQQGFTDPSELFGLLNYDENGNLIGDISIDEITEILKEMPEAKKEDFETFDGIPYQVIRNEAGDVTGFERIPGVETEEDIKTFGGVPYKAIKDGAGNVVRYEEIPGVEGAKTRDDLTAFERLSARNLAVKIFGKRAGTKAENVELVEDLMAGGGMTADQIEDSLRYETVSEEFQGAFKNSFEFITKSGFTVADRIASREYLDELLEDGDTGSAIDFMLGLARDKGTVEERKSVAGRDDAMYALDEVERKLEEYQNEGGETGLLQGNIEKFKENILKRTGDPELARIGNEIAIIVQRYRQLLTGAAFTESEAMEYARLFPGIEKSPELNQALISSMREAYNRYQEGYYIRTMGRKNYEELMNLIYSNIGIRGGGILETSDDLIDIGVEGQDPKVTGNDDPLNLEISSP